MGELSMNYRVLVAAAMLLMPVAAESQTNPKIASTSDVDIKLYDQAVLKDLHNLYITVHDSGGKSETALGIDTNLLSSLVFVAIKRDVPTIKISNDHPRDSAYNQPLLGYMYVRVSCVADANISGCHVEVSVTRAARVLSEDGAGYVGDIQPLKVWSKEAMFLGGTCPMHKQIEDSISDMMTKFAADYYKQNAVAR
jgi:hypothetical protein